MEPIYVDLHIHTSENPNELNSQYDVDILLERIREFTDDSTFLISLTDHNTINKNAYLDLLSVTENVLLGVELHIKNYEEKKPYHCHMFFDLEEINSTNINSINSNLDELYPDKVITNETENIPSLEKIIRIFEKYEFVLLPHGGQSHSTFDKSIPRDREITFDSTIERSIYYNQFDGFTARDDKGLDETHKYFKRLGIYGFVNLLTCSDNYKPENYPQAKSRDANPFLPTWMLAEPTFSGLRLSLSEASRFIYSNEKPSNWSEFIKKVYINNELIDIDIELTPGLNVVIGGSSSGKTLLVDSVFNKLNKDFSDSNYIDLGVENIEVSNPSGMTPHYISQNYIMKVIDQGNDNSGIENIDLIKKVFPEDSDVSKKVRNALDKIKDDIFELIDNVKILEEETENIRRIPILSRLGTDLTNTQNYAKKFLPDNKIFETIKYNKEKYNIDVKQLDDLKEFMEENPFAEKIGEEVQKIKEKLTSAYNLYNFEIDIRKVINNTKTNIDTYLASINQEQQTKRKNFDKLLTSVSRYVKSLNNFTNILNRISKYSITLDSQEVESMGHKLYIENNFELTTDQFIDIVNKYLKTPEKIKDFESISPENFFEDKFSKKSPKVYGYDDFQDKIYDEFRKLNNQNYKIKTKKGKDFEKLSAGWKTSILLDLILGYKDDLAPLIIDQPEDNLATNYINTGLVDSIKKIKSQKQIILVSHNATIPMLADAQNIILCKNEEKIKIRSAKLEESLSGISMVDHIANITDGGKSSIKKRVKKYNLKNFRGDYE